MKARAKRRIPLLVLATLPFLLPGCIATTNYHTGRTAESGVWVVTPGADNILIGNPDEEDFFIEKESPFTPSLGAARGLPRRFEVGARYYIPFTLESNVRWQITPRRWERVAASINVHYGAIIPWAAYLKYGPTVSADIWRFQPFAGFYLFRNGDPWRSPNEEWEDLLETSRVLCLGMGFEIPGGLLIPEINYHYTKDDYDKGFLFFGIGLRVGDRPMEDEKAGA